MIALGLLALITLITLTILITLITLINLILYVMYWVLIALFLSSHGPLRWDTWVTYDPFLTINVIVHWLSCDPGRHAETKGQTFCKTCAYGYYSHHAGQSSCNLISLIALISLIPRSIPLIMLLILQLQKPSTELTPLMNITHVMSTHLMTASVNRDITREV